MPGLGKTTLAIRAAHRLARRFPDAQLFLGLAAHDPGRAPLSPSQALNTLLRTIGVPAAKIPSALSDRAVLWRAEMANRRAVIVLDDAADEEQIRPLLPATDACRVLITARRNLSGLPAAEHIALDVLPMKDAISLFAQIARCGNDDTVEEAIRLCGQLPLAIRLAASRVRSGETVDELIEEYSVESSSLRAGSDEMRAAFDLSYQELSSIHQEVARRLSWHPGEHLTENAAASLAGLSSIEIRATLATLIEHHLLEGSTDTTYRFHTLVRLYLRECSKNEDGPLMIRRALKRLLNYYLNSANQVDRLLHPHRRRPSLASREKMPCVESRSSAHAWFESEWSSMLAVAQYSTNHEWHEEGANLAYLISKTLEESGFWEEALTALEVAFRSAQETGDQPGIIRAALDLSFLKFLGGDDDSALKYADQALTIARQCADNHGSADALDRMGIVHWSRGRYRAALAHCQEAIHLYREIRDRTGEATALNHIGIACWHLGRYDEAASNIQSALAIYRDTQNDRGAAMALNNLGDVQQSRGYHRDALGSYQQSLAIFDNILGRHNRAILSNNIGNVFRYKGNYREALDSYRAALAIYRRTGDRRDMADTYNGIGITFFLWIDTVKLRSIMRRHMILRRISRIRMSVREH